MDISERGSAHTGETGWSRFEPDSPSYTAEEIARERDRYLWSADQFPLDDRVGAALLRRMHCERSCATTG